MSHPAKNRFLTSTFPYLNTIWRTNSYLSFPYIPALRILDFVRSKLPYKMVERIDQGNVESFLNGWHDNRIRVLLFGRTEVIRLRYLTTAFKFRSRAKLGYVQLTDPYAKKIISKYNMAKTKGKKHALKKYD